MGAMPYTPYRKRGFGLLGLCKGSDVRYEGNPKHKEPWQRGRKGSLCPIEAGEVAQRLLDLSASWKGKRYSAYEGRAFCGQEHAPGLWHGYPVGWKEVPDPLRTKWRKEGRISAREIRDFWEQEETP